MANPNTSANISFDFSCQYRPPVGQVSVDFPDSPCSDIGGIIAQEGSCAYFELIDSNSWDAQSSETLSIELIITELLGEAVSSDGQSAALDNIVISRFFNALAYDGTGTNPVLLSIRPAALLQPIVYSGENSSADVFSSVCFYPNPNSGEETLLDFKTYPSFNVKTVFQAGEALRPVVFYTWTTLSYNPIGGEYSVADLEINLSDQLTTYNYSGEHVTSSILVTSYIWNSQYSGESASLVFTNYPPVDLGGINSRSGSTLEAVSLYAYKLLEYAQFGGESVDFDITYIKNKGSPSDNYSGETLSTVLSTQDALPLIGYNGEFASVDVSTSYALDFDAYCGSYGSAILQLRAPITFEGNCRSGEFATSPYINFATRFGAIAHEGSVLISTLAIRPSIELQLQNYASEHSNVTTIQVSKPIGEFSGYAGEDVNIPSISSIENFVFFASENALVSLKTEATLGFESQSSDNASASLETRQSEGIGRLKPITGEMMHVDKLKIIQHHNLYVVFWHDTRVQLDMDSQTYFDLTVDKCCGGPRALKAQDFRIEMDFAEYPDQVHFGDRIVFHVDLCCRPRFDIEAHSGERFDITDKTVYIAQDVEGKPQVNFKSAESLALLSFESVFVHRLCKGYFIPSGNNIFIELTDVLDENCYADYVYTGEVMRAAISNTRGVGGPIYSGETLLIKGLKDSTRNLKLEEIEVGERLDFNLATTIRQSGYAIEGSRMSFKFWEPDWRAFEGQSAVITSLELDVQIEFVESGCLENEYIYMDENGDPIPEKFEPMPIELYPYQHDIKARCY
jgi:hypothetical protein